MDGLTWHILSLSLILQALVEGKFEPVNQLGLLEVSLKFIHSHDWNGFYLFITLGSSALVFEISAIAHLAEMCEKRSHLLADEGVTEDVSLEMGPNLVENHHKLIVINA